MSARARARCGDQGSDWPPIGHAFAPDERAFAQLAAASSEDQLLDRHLDQLGSAKVHVPERLFTGGDRMLSRPCWGWRRRMSLLCALSVERAPRAFVVDQARLSRASATFTDQRCRRLRAHHARRVFVVVAHACDLDRRWCRLRAAIGKRAIQAHEVTAVTAQHSLLPCLLAVRHMTPAAAAAVDLVQSAHRGPGSIPPACEPARALGRIFLCLENQYPVEAQNVAIEGWIIPALEHAVVAAVHPDVDQRQNRQVEGDASVRGGSRMAVTYSARE